MKRLIEKIVFSGLVTACRLATVPTSRSPPLLKATTDGVVRPPSAFSITVGSPPSRTDMHELVVPRSMPMVLAMGMRLLAATNLSRFDEDLSALETLRGGRRPRPRAHPAERALVAPGPLRVAGAPAVAQQVDVELQLLPARGDGEHVVVQLLERRARAEQPEPRADARHV